MWRGTWNPPGSSYITGLAPAPLPRNGSSPMALAPQIRPSQPLEMIYRQTPEGDILLNQTGLAPLYAASVLC